MQPIIIKLKNVFDVVEDSKKKEMAEQPFDELLDNEIKKPPRKRQY